MQTGNVDSIERFIKPLIQAMPSESQPTTDDIGPSSSFEEASQRSTCSASVRSQTSVVDHVTLEQERMDRTNDVRERLGPLIQRLRESVKNMQSLESSMRTSTGGDCDRETYHGLRPGQSRQLVHENMEMVKKKMFRLKTMEEELNNSEDRRITLHHYFQQQVSLQATRAKTEKQNGVSDYQHRIAELEEEICILKEKSVLVDDLRVENARLTERTKDVERLAHELELEKSLRRKLELNLFEHQHKMNEQAVNYDSLSCKFEHLSSTIANLTGIMYAQENEIMDTMTLHKRYISNTSSPPEMIEHLENHDNSTLTEPMTSFSWTESSISNDDGSIVDIIDPNNDSKTVDELFVRLDDIESRSTVELMQARIDALNRENAGLRESTSRTLKNYKTCHEEMNKQASMIESLRQKLDCDKSVGGDNS